jgi:hypothetical protein
MNWEYVDGKDRQKERGLKETDLLHEELKEDIWN